MMHDSEEKLKMLKKLGVKFIEFGTDGLPYKVEFFPEAASDDDALEKKPRADEKVNEATGLTRSRSQDMFLMDE